MRFIANVRLLLWHPTQPRLRTKEEENRDIAVAEIVQALYTVPQIKRTPDVTLGYYMRWFKTTIHRTGNTR